MLYLCFPFRKNLSPCRGVVKFAGRRRRVRDPAADKWRNYTHVELYLLHSENLNTREIRIARDRRSVCWQREIPGVAYPVPREEMTFSGSDGPIPELCHEMDSLGPAVSKLQGKTERRLPLSSIAVVTLLLFLSDLSLSRFIFLSFSFSPHWIPVGASSLLSLEQRGEHLLSSTIPTSTGPTGKGLHGPEHPTSIRHFGPCYDTPLAWLPYCEILAAFFPHPFTSSPSTFPAALFLLHSTFFIVSIFSPPFFLFFFFTFISPSLQTLFFSFSFSFPPCSTVCYPFVLLRFFACFKSLDPCIPFLSFSTDTVFYFSFFFLNTLSTGISFVPLSRFKVSHRFPSTGGGRNSVVEISL